MLYTRITTGRESRVSRLKIAGRSLIVKKRMPEGHQNYLVEQYIYNALSELGVHVPQVIFATRHMLVMKAFLGDELDDKTSLFDRKEIFAAAAHDLAACRAVSVEGFGELVLEKNTLRGTSASWIEYLETVEPMFESSVLMKSGVSPRAAKKLAAHWLAQKTQINLKTSNLVHGDFAMSAIFVHKQAYEGLIDFGDALAGDPLIDLAYCRYKEITKPYGYKIYRQLLESYCATAEVRISADTEARIRFYMIYWGLKRLKDCADRDLQQKFGSKLNEVAKILERRS